MNNSPRIRFVLIFFVLISALEAQSIDLPELSGKFLFQVKMGNSTDSIQKVFRSLSAAEIAKGLKDDTSKKTFWINVYNAWYQVLAQEGLKAPKIFTDKKLSFKDFSLSLDDIEHGILRKHRWKYSLGYFGQLAPSKIILMLTVETIDFRIHFALNCGARSCPPILFYETSKLDQQLDWAAELFLQQETKVNSGTKVVQVTKIMQWFSGDFGGAEGQKKILSRYLKKDFSGYKISYKEYDWTSDLMNFRN